MVYIERIIVKESRTISLFIQSEKERKLFTKVNNLGKNLPSKEKQEQLKNEFIQEIVGAGYKDLTREEVQEIEQQKKEYQQELTKLSALEKERNLQEFIIRFTYDSSKLSGVVVTLRQTSLILKWKKNIRLFISQLKMGIIITMFLINTK